MPSVYDLMSDEEERALVEHAMRAARSKYLAILRESKARIKEIGEFGEEERQQLRYNEELLYNERREAVGEETKARVTEIEECGEEQRQLLKTNEKLLYEARREAMWEESRSRVTEIEEFGMEQRHQLKVNEELLFDERREAMWEESNARTTEIEESGKVERAAIVEQGGTSLKELKTTKDLERKCVVQMYAAEQAARVAAVKAERDLRMELMREEMKLKMELMKKNAARASSTVDEDCEIVGESSNPAGFSKRERQSRESPRVSKRKRIS
jgi:hypothetical protein